MRPLLCWFGHRWTGPVIRTRETIPFFGSELDGFTTWADHRTCRNCGPLTKSMMALTFLGVPRSIHSYVRTGWKPTKKEDSS